MQDEVCEVHDPRKKIKIDISQTEETKLPIEDKNQEIYKIKVINPQIPKHIRTAVIKVSCYQKRTFGSCAVCYSIEDKSGDLFVYKGKLFVGDSKASSSLIYLKKILEFCIEHKVTDFLLETDIEIIMHILHQK